MIRDRESRTPLTWVRNSRVITAFCFASSQITTFEQGTRSITPTRVQYFLVNGLTDLVLWKLRLFPSTDKSDVIRPAQHLSNSNTGVEVCAINLRSALDCFKPDRGLNHTAPSDDELARTSRDLELAWLGVEDCSKGSL